jgi:DNA-binding transcriptional regulator LsrR (DeoR family)
MAEPSPTDIRVKLIALMLSRRKAAGEIADVLGVSPSTVSRDKTEAEVKGWLVDVPYCALPAEEIVLLEAMLHQPRLLEALQAEQPHDRKWLRRLRILHAGSPPRVQSPKAYEGYRDRFGAEVAEHLLENVLPYVHSMGITWGGTLRSVVTGIERSRLRPLMNVEFLPVCGAPPDAIEDALRASSYLVAALDAVLNHAHKNPNNFTGVSASIAAEFTPAERRVLERYFRGNAGYCRVFGVDGKPGLIDTMDAVMTSVGSTNRDENPWIDAAAKAADVDPLLLCASVLGNVGGWFLARHDLDKSRRAMVDAINARWTGIRPAHYERCNARANGHGGAILVAIGQKADIVLECVRSGLVAELLIDPPLANALRQKLRLEPEPPPGCIDPA